MVNFCTQSTIFHTPQQPFNPIRSQSYKSPETNLCMRSMTGRGRWVNLLKMMKVVMVTHFCHLPPLHVLKWRTICCVRVNIILLQDKVGFECDGTRAFFVSHLNLGPIVKSMLFLNCWCVTTIFLIQLDLTLGPRLRYDAKFVFSQIMISWHHQTRKNLNPEMFSYCGSPLSPIRTSSTTWHSQN